MKTLKTLLLFLCLFGTFLTFGQNQIIYDFHKGTLINNDFVQDGKIKPIQINDFAVFKIININTFRFAAEIEGRSINYLTEMPSELQAIFRQPKSTTEKNTSEGLEEAQEAVEKMKAELGTASEKAEKKNENAEDASLELSKVQIELEKIIKEFEATKKELATLKTAPVRANERAENNRKVAKAQADSTIKAEVKAAVEKKLETIQKQVAAAESSNAFKEAMENLVKACNEYLKVAEKVAAIKFTRADMINLSKQDWERWEQMRDNLPSVNTEAMKGDFKEFVKFYAQALSHYRMAKITAKAAGASNEEIKLIEDAAEQLEEGHHKITEDDFLKLIEDIMVLDKAMQNPKSFTAISPLIQIDGDFVSFDVKTPPARVNDLLPHTPNRTFRVEIPARGGLKADFGVGPAFSFGRGSKDSSFFLSPKTGSSDIGILKKGENKNIIVPALVAMMHAYFRSGRNYSVGGMFGVGVNFKSVNAPTASYYLGLSLVLGKQQKVTASAGASLLRVDRLKSNYILGGEYPKNLAIADVTEKAYQPSPFFSISYNITNRIEVK